jgi:hypothetical protein
LRARILLYAKAISRDESCATTSASLAGVMPWASRTSSLRGTFMSTSIRATSCDGMAMASGAISGSM